MDNTILLIDGSSFIFRAFYAVKNLTSPSGMPTNAIYGIVNMLKQMQKKYTTPYWVCVFDAKGKTFRDDIYPEYKANRRETPEELIVQFPYIHELVADLGIPVIVQEGVEADDVIATIAKKYAARGHKILIATGDKDFGQIVDENITLVNTMSNELLDIAGVEAKFGVKPEQIIDYLSLVGDSADNVPGVHKCGPKTAQKWLQEYGSIANLMANQDKLAGVVGENFRSARDWLPTAQRLITIDCEVKINVADIEQLENLQMNPPLWEKLQTTYRELNFRNWLREVEAYLASNPNQANSSVESASETPETKNSTLETNEESSLEPSDLDLFNQPDIQQVSKTEKQATIIERSLLQVTTLAELTPLIQQIINNRQPSAFYIFLEDYQNHCSPISMISITTEQNLYLISLQDSNHQELLFSEDQESASKIRALAQYWESPLPKVCHNYKLQRYILSNYGITPQNIVGDLELASYIQRSQQEHNLAAIMQRFAATKTITTVEELLGKGAKRQFFSSLASEQQIQFATQISQSMLEAEQDIKHSLNKSEQNLYLNVELPLAELLYQIECQGMKIDITKLKILANEMHATIQQLETKIFAKTQIVFNLNSPKQLQDVLFNQLKLPTSGIAKNIAGYSTNEEALNILAESGYDIAEALLEYRYLNKLLNTYIDRLPQLADRGGFLHTSLEQTIVTSGRLSSKDPNLQNIPVRSHYGQAIRECFIAKEGHQLICADYSQIELRILAHISNDHNLIAAFNSDADIHQITASQIFHKGLNEVTKDERRYAKSINFGLIYGKSVFGLAKELKIERSAAKLYIDNYFANYPQVKAYMENIKELAHRDGYVTTFHGRKIFLANINAGNNILRQAEERLALNAPMQGTAADIIKIAMLNVNGWLEAKGLKTKMVLQVHDELIFQVPNEEVELVSANLERLMAETTKLAVPLKVEVKAASNWGDAH